MEYCAILRPRAGSTPPSDRDDAYASLEAPDVLPVLSLLLFTGALLARPLVRLLPRELRPYPWGLVLPVAVGLFASALGVGLALLSLRGARRRGLARLSLLLNGVVLVLNALVVAAMVWIFER